MAVIALFFPFLVQKYGIWNPKIHPLVAHCCLVDIRNTFWFYETQIDPSATLLLLLRSSKTASLSSDFVRIYSFNCQKILASSERLGVTAINNKHLHLKVFPEGRHRGSGVHFSAAITTTSPLIFI